MIVAEHLKGKDRLAYEIIYDESKNIIGLNQLNADSLIMVSEPQLGRKDKITWHQIPPEEHKYQESIKLKDSKIFFVGEPDTNTDRLLYSDLHDINKLTSHDMSEEEIEKMKQDLRANDERKIQSRRDKRLLTMTLEDKGFKATVEMSYVKILDLKEAFNIDIRELMFKQLEDQLELLKDKK